MRLIAMTFCAAIAASQPVLAQDFSAKTIKNFITHFAADELSEGEKREAMNIARDDVLSHGNKVLMLHELLEQADALRHYDAHNTSVPLDEIAGTNGGRSIQTASVDIR